MKIFSLCPNCDKLRVLVFYPGIVRDDRIYLDVLRCPKCDQLFDVGDTLLQTLTADEIPL